MRLSIFTDELGIDLKEGAPILKEWGLETVDFRSKLLGKHLDHLDSSELNDVKALLDEYGFTVGCLESSIGKVHLPDDGARVQSERAKLDRLKVAADVLGCRLIRAFFF